MQEQVRRNKLGLLRRMYDSMYQWQIDFIESTKDHDASALLGGNRTGKTRTGLIIDAYHLRGDYPESWPGIKYETPPMCWLLGFSGEKTRDLLQTKLFGRYVEKGFEGGMIPKEMILDWRSMQGTVGAMREVRVKHKNGTATCQFWSYSQGQHALMGDSIYHYHFDEEPKDSAIWPQVVTRTVTGGDDKKGGGGILTLTPENGKTQLVCQFMGEDIEVEDEADISLANTSGMYLQTATWDQCPHIDDDMRRKTLAKYPAHQRKMRSMGVPLLGTGLIYDFDEDDIKCPAFTEVPDHWFVINGMDFGWDHPQAFVQIVWDRDADIFYVINAWKGRKKQPFEAWHIVKRWCEDIPTAWPADGNSTEKGSAKTQVSYYNETGFNMLQDHATFEDGGVGVWVGIKEIHDLFKTGRMKIVKSLHEVFEEIRQYHTKTSGENKNEIKIVKIKDDFLDAIRYAYVMRRYAIRICDLNPEEYSYQNQSTERDQLTGY